MFACSGEPKRSALLEEDSLRRQQGPAWPTRWGWDNISISRGTLSTIVREYCETWAPGYSWDAHSCQPAVLKDPSNNCILLKVHLITSHWRKKITTKCSSFLTFTFCPCPLFMVCLFSLSISLHLQAHSSPPIFTFYNQNKSLLSRSGRRVTQINFANQFWGYQEANFTVAIWMKKGRSSPEHLCFVFDNNKSITLSFVFWLSDSMI